MPEKKTLERAEQDKREGKSPSTQAGEFVREEMDHIREGKHGARSTKQAIAIGLSKARRAGVKLPPPKEGAASGKTRRRAKDDIASASKPRKPSRTRSRATTQALKREELVVYDVRGRVRATLWDGPAGRGTHIVRWDTGALEPGVYFLRLVAEPTGILERFIVVR